MTELLRANKFFTKLHMTELLSTLTPVAALALVFLLTFFMLGADMMLPGKPGFSLYACWVAGLVGGKLMNLVGQPPLLGMLIAGITLRNIGSPSLVDGLPNSWGSAVRVFGLSVILMRSGLELDLGAIGRIGAACVRLTVCPGCSEALMVGIASKVLFGMPISLALALGFILAAVSPAVVVGGMFDLQRRGYGVAKGIPSLVVAAASFDDVVAITGYSLCIGFAISSEDSNLFWEAMHGPINVGLGLALGIAGGHFVSVHAMWDTRLKRSMVVACMGLTLAFACSSFHFTGGGALASLITTCVAARRWQQLSISVSKDEANDDGQEHTQEDEESTKSSSSDGDASSHWAHEVETDLAAIWSFLAQPLLFCVIGSALNFAELDAGTIPMSIIVVGCGVMVRCPVASFVLFGTPLNRIERSFVGLAWIPKATVQAALGGIPLDLVRTSMDPSKDPELYAQYEKWGLQILTTAVLSILITAPVGLLVIQNLGHRWLARNGACDAAAEELAETSQLEKAPRSGSMKRRNTFEMQKDVLARIPSEDETIAAQTQKQYAASDCDVVDLEDIKLEKKPQQELPVEEPAGKSTRLQFVVAMCLPIRMSARSLLMKEAHSVAEHGA